MLAAEQLEQPENEAIIETENAKKVVEELEQQGGEAGVLHY